MKRRDWLLGAAALSAGAAWARDELGAAEAASAPAAAPAWRLEDLDWADVSRQRPVPVRLYLPTARPAQGLPLVVFSHGIGGSRRGYSYLGQHLAAQGMAALHVQHVGSDRALWSGSVFSLVGRLQAAAQTAEARARALDVRFALDQLQRERPELVDPHRIAMAGHSYGANTSLLLAGAAIPGEAPLADPRIRAAVFISAPPLHGVPEPERALAAIRLPSLHITATDDVIRVPGYTSVAAERVALFEATGSAVKGLAVFEGGSHSVFTDRGGTGGPVANPRIKRATKELVADFVQGQFGGDAALRLGQWHQRHQGLLARWVPPTA
ncbi:alpha/beta hydrolase family protein [Inhella crocodyli]|uniref:Acetylhydrolase n=1 Tax=Inhella crocodyli TaxID=2499851 RepID=A0A437LAI5_9BURK|nr:acetylhydrolase [Inhella crocodyli]RVT82406.1 acetylhydrolase [Inhella crocodyli]